MNERRQVVVEVAATTSMEPAGLDEDLSDWFWANVHLVPEEYRDSGHTRVRRYDLDSNPPWRVGLIYVREETDEEIKARANGKDD
jgi:hypothetical protein